MFEYERILTSRTSLGIGFGFMLPFERNIKKAEKTYSISNLRATVLNTFIGYRFYLNQSTYSRFYISPTVGYHYIKRVKNGRISINKSFNTLTVNIDENYATTISLGLKVDYQDSIYGRFILGINAELYTT
jgi:hypothetical protein